MGGFKNRRPTLPISRALKIAHSKNANMKRNDDVFTGWACVPWAHVIYKWQRPGLKAFGVR